MASSLNGSIVIMTAIIIVAEAIAFIIKIAGNGWFRIVRLIVNEPPNEE
jgi:hypothetical protein